MDGWMDGWMDRQMDGWMDCVFRIVCSEMQFTSDKI